MNRFFMFMSACGCVAIVLVAVTLFIGLPANPKVVVKSIPIDVSKSYVY